MSQPSDKILYEEINPFPEKVAGRGDSEEGLDSLEPIELDDISGDHEEILLADEKSTRLSLPIVDEHSDSVKPENSISFDIESLASEIDSMANIPLAVGYDGNDEDFLEIQENIELPIGENSNNSIRIDLNTLEEVEESDVLSTGDDAALLFDEHDNLEKNSLLSGDPADFTVTSVEGYGSIRPDRLVSYLELRKFDSHGSVKGGSKNELHVTIEGDEGRVGSKVLLGPSGSVEDIAESYDFNVSPLTLDDEIKVMGDDPVEKEPVALKPPVEKPVIEPRQVKMPDDFSLKPIDLAEAERIAREDIVILSENDLIEELETIHIFSETENTTPRVSAPVTRRFDYITPAESALDNSHRDSIEEDIVASRALVIEEDVSDIRNKLSTSRTGFSSSLPVEDEIIDITDQVVILDDESDMNRFVASIDESKREDMKRLLHYLDGLFEKLPEDVVKNFADSEYFDLYVKIMNELEA